MKELSNTMSTNNLRIQTFSWHPLTVWAWTGLFLLGCHPAALRPQTKKAPSTHSSQTVCKTKDLNPSVEELIPGLFIARGFDLGHTLLIQTAEGNVVVDVSMNPARAKKVKAALQAKAPGKTRAIIYTHSHLDHIGGASVWAEEGTQIWATETFFPHLMKQYGAFQNAEKLRAARQWAAHISEEDLPCSSIGRRIDLIESLETGIRIPTHTFKKQKTLSFGDVTLELIEAHGETHDQLFVWIPQWEVLLAGDNYYDAFPNLYTLRGTSPRPVNQWIQSLDAMRRRNPEILVPSHTAPIVGKKKVQEVLTHYRDAIAWVRNAVVQGANRGESIDVLANSIQLPEHLARQPYLQELYGQIDWSARAIYGNNLGWFDGRPAKLYPPTKVTQREISLMGGPEAVVAEAMQALENKDPRWAVHLLGKLADSGLQTKEDTSSLRAEALEALADQTGNTNGRGYLLESAYELREGTKKLPRPVVDEGFLSHLPLDVLFDALAVRLFADQALDVHESVSFFFSDTGERFNVTVRKGVAEIVKGEPLPGTPDPVATVRTDSMTWRRLSLKTQSPLAALATGRLKVSKLLTFNKFMKRFDQTL